MISAEVKADVSVKTKALTKVMQICLCDPLVRQALYFISPKLRVKVSRFGKARKGQADSFRVEMGRPNSIERKFVKLCVKSGEPFPLKRVRVNLYPKKRK